MQEGSFTDYILKHHVRCTYQHNYIESTSNAQPSRNGSDSANDSTVGQTNCHKQLMLPYIIYFEEVNDGQSAEASIPSKVDVGNTGEHYQLSSKIKLQTLMYSCVMMSCIMFNICSLDTLLKARSCQSMRLLH